MSLDSAGKEGMRGEEVEKYYRDGHFREIAEYCETDVVNAYRAWLRYELFHGRLSDPDFHASELSLVDFIKARANTKPRLSDSV
jgi:3'-5' exonuclease